MNYLIIDGISENSISFAETDTLYY